MMFDMTSFTNGLSANGFCLLPTAVDLATVGNLLVACQAAFVIDGGHERARSSRGHVYAARNLLDAVPLVKTFWKTAVLREVLVATLGDHCGLVRVLFFDKPPDRSWALAWHKDTAIAVKDNSLVSAYCSRPTVKAGVPHVVASDAWLHQMLTLRVHLDDVDDTNGPLRVVPGSHVSSHSEGVGVNQAVTIHAKTGDVLAMRPLITHGSGISAPGVTRHRRILHLEFAASEDLSDGYRWHDFVALQ